MTEDESKKLHDTSSFHYDAVQESEVCGCFYCLGTFAPSEIKEWHTEKNDLRTAHCPKCWIDSVLPGVSDPEVLKEMNDKWFKRTISYGIERVKDLSLEIINFTDEPDGDDLLALADTAKELAELVMDNFSFGWR